MKKFLVIASALLMFGCGTTGKEAAKTAADVNAAVKDAAVEANAAAKDANAAAKDAAADAKAADAAVKDAAADANAAAKAAEKSLDKEVVKSVVTAHVADIQACYLDALSKNKDLAGKITMSWTVKDGAVKSAEVVRNATTINDTVMETCIITKSNTWQFPNSANEVRIEYPFDFSSEKK
ncbi:MAG: AgmX/PglI C-terminal domain-containing protein [Proteobacteria bacterium]|nr:AgmX/PglI C-terminal domain-containing protein [Pseudomonadota bacterium]